MVALSRPAADGGRAGAWPEGRAGSRPAGDRRDLFDVPFAVAGARVMLAQLDRALEHEAGTRAGVDAEDLHKMRVATRRLRVAVRTFGKVLAPAPDVVAPLGPRLPVGPAVRATQALAAALGRVRDLDVFVAAVREHAATAGGLDREALERVVADRLAERAAAREELLCFLDGEAMAALRHDFRDGLAALAGNHAEGRADRGAGPGGETVRERAPRAIVRSLRALRTCGATLQAPTIDELHQVRIRAKRFRYTCEFFAPAFAAALDQSIATATAIQDTLGALHDVEVWEGVLLADIGRIAGDPARAADAAAIARLIGDYRAHRDEALRRFRERWAELPRPKRLRRTLLKVTRG
jgi:CHAD domain-containing protein